MNVTSSIAEIAHTFPIYVLISSLLEGIIFQDNRGLYFFIAATINCIINVLLKMSFTHIASYRSDRPHDAPDKCDDRYGNPSGHSQFAWFFSTFWILYILNTNTFPNTVSNILSIICLILIAMIVSFSRVYIKCHTKDQIITGGIIGCVIGVISFYVVKPYL